MGALSKYLYHIDLIMYCVWVCVLVGCLIVLKAPSIEMSGMGDLKALQSKAGDAKKDADENQISEEQFYRCFSDINCNLGKEALDDVYKCYAIPNKTEASQYVLWFEDSPKGDFKKEDLSIDGINKKFCVLPYEDQISISKSVNSKREASQIFIQLPTDGSRIVNDHFATKASTNLKEMCKNAGDRNRCLRLKKGTECISQLIETYVATQKCDTIVNEVPIPEGAPTSLG